jgi:hypothetical protein
MSEPANPTLGYQTPQGLGWNAAHQFRSVHGISIALRVVLALALAGLILQILFLYSQVHLLQTAKAGGPVTPAQARANDARILVSHSFVLFLMLAGGILWFIWIYRAYANLPVFTGMPTKHTKGWAVGAYFVPVLNLVRVPEMLSEAYKASHPQRASGGVFIVTWWLAWIASGIIGNIAAIVMQTPPGARADFDALIEGTWTLACGNAFAVLAGILAIFLVTKISAWQTGTVNPAPYSVP